MGCHTWIYKKVSSLPKLEKNNILIKKLSDTINNQLAFKTDREEYIKKLRELTVYSVEECGNFFDRYQAKKVQLIQAVDEYINNPDATIFAGIYKSMNPCSSNLYCYNNTYYYYVDVDKGFRCFSYNHNPFTSYAELIRFLETLPESSIKFYGDNNEYNIDGISEQLILYLIDLFKHDDILVEFG